MHVNVKDIVSTMNALRQAKEPGAKPVLASLGTVSDEVQAALSVAGYELWNRPRLEAEVGMAIVALVERGEGLGAFQWPAGSSGPPPPASEAITVAPPPEPAAAPAAAVTPTVEAIVAAAAPGKEEPQPSQVCGEVPHVEVFSVPQESDGDFPVMKPRLSQSEARQKAKEAMPRLAKLEPVKVPHYAFRYSVKLHDPSRDKREASGWALVNGCTSDAFAQEEEPVAGAFEGVELDVETEQARAQQSARECALATSASERRERTSTNTAIIISRKRIVPIEDTLKLAPKGIWLVPAWRATGPQGTLLVNGVTGALEIEKKRRVLSSDAELFT